MPAHAPRLAARATLACAVVIAACRSEVPAVPSPASPPIVAAHVPPALPPTESFAGPLLYIDDVHVRLGADLVGVASPPPDRLRIIDQLADRLTERRRRDGGGTPPGPPGEIAVQIGADVPFYVAASAITTCAFAGYPTIRLRLGSACVKLRVPVPRPPSDEGWHLPLFGGRRQVGVHVGRTSLEVKVAVAFDAVETDGEPQTVLDWTPLPYRPVEHGQGPRYPALSEALSEVCRDVEPPCIEGVALSTDQDVAFGDLAGALGAVAAAYRGSPTASCQETPGLLVSFRRGGVGWITTRMPRPRPPEIQQAVRDHFPKIRACYDEGLRREPTLTGRVVVRFVLSPDGHVTQAEEDSRAVADIALASRAPTAPRLPDKSVVRCVVEEIRTLVVPKFRGIDVSVVYPIMLSPSE